MSTTSENFERQIQRIHELIEQPGSVITWDDHIPDPDNPSQLRQIDITIRREEQLTLVECRVHKKPQDVKWIEELIGKRISLRADAVLAVSYEGFTKGAIAKARSHGIILRDFKSLTEEEIRQWGHKTKLWISYHNFSGVVITYLFDIEATNKVTAQDVFDHLTDNKRFNEMIELIVGELDQRNIERFPLPFFVNIKPKSELIVAGHHAKDVFFEAEYNVIKAEASITSVVAYDAPDIDSLEREVIVEDVSIPDFEITQSSNIVTVALDLSRIPIPLNSRIRDIVFDFKRPVNVKGIYFLGKPESFIPITDLKTKVFFN